MSSVTVEIFPGIDAVFRASRESPKERERPMSVSQEGLGEIKYLLQRLRRVVDNLDDQSQRSLFSNDDTRPRYGQRPRRGEK
jgi:hypothetical protein